jgi:type IV secretion system protein TrbE
MMNLREYRNRPESLADYLPWAGLVAPGIVLNKDGAFQRTACLRGPDLDSSTEGELASTAARLNNALKRLGTGWALFVEAERRATVTYPVSDFSQALAWLVDQERRADFEEAGSHFESTYHFTLVFLPPPEAHSRAGQFLFESTHRQAVDWREHLTSFTSETDRFFALLDSVMPELRWLSDDETLTYLHATVSTHCHPVSTPDVSFCLDALLIDRPLTGGLAPRLGDEHVRVLTVRGFPNGTWPGLLDELNRLGFAYHWTTRFLFLDKTEAEREIAKIRRQWFAKRKGIATLLKETIFQQESPLVDSDAQNKAIDADAALQEVGSDLVSYGYVTSTLVVTDRDPSVADERLKAAERVIQNKGFVCISETFNAVEAWLGSLPGHVYANVRQPPISTQVLSHLIPISAVWAGPERNTHLDGPPLMMTRTDGATPFRLSLHIGDVGHTLIIGPTGAGKSVLLTTLLLQFHRYPNARAFVFDNGRSSRAVILGLGGEYYDLGTEGSIAFQPLAQIDQDTHRAWAAEWLASLFAHEGVQITPDVKDALWSGLLSLSSAPANERTLTGLSAVLQSNALRQALQPYTLSGPHGRLLDADRDQFSRARIQGFETEELMQTRTALLPVLTNIFHQLELLLDGAPTLLILDEAWLRLDDPTFAGRIREWLKMLRKKNVSVIFATQSLADVKDSTIAPALIESCPTRIFLPSPQAIEPQLRSVYTGFGLNDRQIELIANAQPKRHYYYQSPLGNRLFELGLGPLALAFVGASKPEDQRAMDAILAEHGTQGDAFATAWLNHWRLPWAADLLKEFPRQEIAP